MKYIPQYILAILMLISIFLVAFTYYIQRPQPTFERLVSKPMPTEITKIKFERYGTKHTPILFQIETNSKQTLLKKLKKVCSLSKISANMIPSFVSKTDTNLTKIIKNSPEIFMSKEYNLSNPKQKRFCLEFFQNRKIYLYVNGN